MRHVLVLIWLSVAGVHAGSASAQHAAESTTASNGELVRLRGCIVGRSLRSTHADPATVAGSLTASDMYRLTGSREVRRQIKAANAKFVAVVGTMKPGPRAVVKGKRIGKVTLGVGATQGATSPLDERPDATPEITVSAIEVLQPTCN